MKKKQKQNKHVNILTIEKRQKQARIGVIEDISIQQINENIKQAEKDWIDLKEKGK